jgi:DNA-binding transcriptional LysR family regulator
MEFRHLEAFVVVAEELNFRRAAQRLRVSQSPLSQQIKRLEHEVGTPLFRRTTRRVALTAAGEAFLTEARRALASAHTAPRVARQAAAGQVGALRLGFTGPASYQALLITTRKFRQHRPNVRLDIVGPYYSGELVERLHHDQLDACLVRLPVSPSGLRIREITRDTMAVAVPPDHALAGHTSARLSELRDQPVIGYPSDRGASIASSVHSAFIRHEASPNIVQEAPDTHTILVLVGAGTGIGFVPMSAEHLNVPGVVLVPVADIPPLPLALAWRTDDPNPALHALVDLLAEIAVAYRDA